MEAFFYLFTLFVGHRKTETIKEYFLNKICSSFFLFLGALHCSGSSKHNCLPPAVTLRSALTASIRRDFGYLVHHLL